MSFTNNFYLAVYPTTQKQYHLIMNANPSYFTVDWETRPVEQITWPSATNFCATLKKKAGNRAFKLPTEAQWEYACRAGTTTIFYNGTTITNEETDANAMLIGACAANRDWLYTHWTNYTADATTKTRPESIGGTRKVGSYAMNGFGLFDMNGNVWQWCSDWAAENLGTEAVVNPEGPSSGSYVCIAAAVGATPRTPCGPVIATGSRPRSGTPATVSACPAPRRIDCLNKY